MKDEIKAEFDKLHEENAELRKEIADLKKQQEEEDEDELD